MSTPYRRITAGELRAALRESGWDAYKASRLLGITPDAMYRRCHRMGVSITDLRMQAAVAAGVAAATPQEVVTAKDVSEDALLASAVVDAAALAMRVQELEAELEAERRISALLGQKLEAAVCPC